MQEFVYRWGVKQMRVNKLTGQPPKAKKESQDMKITTIDDAVFQYAQTSKPTPTINKMI